MTNEVIMPAGSGGPDAVASPAGFYGGLAAEYDAMTGFGERLPRAAAFARVVRERFPPSLRVLDAATGTGLYAIAFAQAGATAVCGLDLSAPMLVRAAQHAVAFGVPGIRWQDGSLTALPAAWTGAFDLALCMGNSLPHLLTEAELATALAGFRCGLTPGGTLVLQVLNYARVLAQRERLISVDRAGDLEFIRFQDFLEGNLLRFNVLRLDWRQTPPAPQWHAVELRAWTAAELRTALVAAGFANLVNFGSLAFAPFDETSSDTLLLAARAPS